LILIPYIRQSRRNERDVSFEQQWDAIAGWSRSNRAKLTVSSLHAAEAEGLVERNTSGAKQWRERELGRVIEACRRKQASGVIVFDQSRLSREDLLGTAEVWDALEKAKADLIDATGGGKVNRMQYVLKAEMNRQQWEAARDRGDDSRRRHIAAGIHGGAKVPFGYRRGDDRRFVIHEEEAEGVRCLFRSRAKEVSWNSIAAEMDRRWPLEGAWTQQRLRHMVGSDVYLGVARSGNHVNREAHAAIVTRAEWEAAQTKKRRTRSRGAPRLLSNIARCATCGYGLRKDKARSDYDRYSCPGRRAKGICEHPVTVGRERLEAFITETFLKRLDAEPVVVGATTVGEDVVDAVRRLEDADAELRRYLGMTTLVRNVGEEAFAAGARERVEARDAVRVEVAELQRALSAAPMPTALADEWPNFSVEERRSVLMAGIQAVLVYPAAARGSRLPVAARVKVVWVDEELPVLPGLDT
jgi:DNA invertase Pin-like site-specific DNA recombinase